jgi:hypothetical protein
MRFEFAHRSAQSTTGHEVNFALFNAKPNISTDSERQKLLNALTYEAQGAGYIIDASGLVYEEHRHIFTFGDPFVVDYCKKNGIPRMTNWIEVG